MPNNTTSPSTFRAEIPRRVVDIPGRSNDKHADEGRRLTVGREIQLTGEITSCDKLIVEGQVEANLAKAGSVEVSKDGIFKGTAEVNEAEISGLFEGTLTVHEKLHVTPTGRIIGTVNYKAIVVEAGGKVNGKIETIEE